uniref:WH2 domain-containing protein n=1 Tax=Periophthalmus magnuspinnatus TaxID=409849 RepID=A0A3B4BAF3_9GOBI
GQCVLFLSAFLPRKRMKPRAPPPPQVPQPAPRRTFRNANSQDEATDRDMKENMLSQSLELRLTLPTGFQTNVIEDGSKALMDVLVELCSRYHLNPSLHTLELFTPEGHPLGFKPNALLGSLNVACVLIKEKVLEERQVRRPAPKVPEKTVRLLVNYHGSQKAVVRVNPQLLLQDLVPVICDKCEFDPALIVLLKDSISRQELPLDKSLSHLGVKELYVHDKSLVLQPKMASAPALNYSGILAVSTMLGSQYVEERPRMSQSQSSMNISKTSPKAEAKKRRAPAPPGVSTHSTEHLSYDTNQISLGLDAQQRKRKAPAPPPTPVSLSSGSEDVSATATPVSQHIQDPTPQSAACFTSLDLRPSTPSSTTSDSLAVQDSSSEFSQSLEESDAASHCSTTTGTTVSGFAQVQSITKSSISRTKKSESTTNISSADVTTASSSRSDTESAINLKMEETENNRHSGVAWLHSMQSSAAKGQCKEISPEETVSLGSNSSGMSLPDQGYTASEGMVDGEDSGVVSSPSETHTTSPDGSLSLDGSTGGERRMGTAADNFSDSDEGSWGSRHSNSKSIKHQDLSAQLHQTLADLESCLADTNEVPVSIVDHDVPVTTIDEVLPDEGFWADSIVANGTVLCLVSSSFSDELQNRNNNAHTATETNKAYSTESKQLSQHKQNSMQEPSKTHKKKDTTMELKNIHQAALKQVTQEAVDLPKVHHTISTSKPFQSKITPNVTSRFGMKTFTVVPPKPAVLHATAGEPPATTPGAIKIDEQGNMVKVFHHRTPGVSDLRNGHDSSLHGKAKAFWSSNEKQEGAVGALSKSTPQIDQRPAQPPFITDVRRDLTFLKPSRRTSSQYVASAITKYAPKTTIKPDYNPASQEFTPKTQNTEDGTDDVKEAGTSEMSFEFGKESFRIQETQKSANNKSVSSTQLNVKVSDTFKSVQRRITILPSNPKTDKTPSVTITDSEASPEPPAVTVFGPVKKFRPVICRSVEKETSLHSSLMEAIQSGGGKERLKKISTSGAKKPSYVEEESERSALMAAIRAQGNSGRLRKTKSEAAGELENFRKTALDVNSSAQISSTPFSPQSSVPPPPAPPVAPPPTPPVLPAPKSFTLSQQNMNSAMAREAMLEAIRSGSAAEKLKKVAVPAKTVQVNGKLGTIKATSSTMS